MAKKSSIKPLWNKNQVRRLFEHFGDRIDDVCLDILQRTGEEFVKVARESGQYIDRTGNLRSSIGYIIVQDGEIIGQDFKLSEKEGTDKATGKKEAEQLAFDLARTYNKGLVLIGVAGMKYAAYVEAMEDKDVISFAALQADAFVEQQSKAIFKALK